MPMLATDNRGAAKEREMTFSDNRIQHYWDPGRTLGQSISRSLNMKNDIAWDVYLVYPPGHVWDAELPPLPAFWMHQLDEEPSLFLDPFQLKQSVFGMIEKYGLD